MKRRVIILIVVLAVLAACGSNEVDGSAASGTGTELPTTSSTGGPTSTAGTTSSPNAASTTSMPRQTSLGPVELWEQADLPDVTRFGPDIRRVVLVAADDVLNVRIGAGADGEISGMLASGTVVGLTGPMRQLGTSTWSEIATPTGTGWVNGYFLAKIVADDDFRSDEQVIALLDRMADIIEAKGDLSEIASWRGLYVSHHAEPVRFTPEQLRTVLTDPTTYKWPSNALDVSDPSQADEIPGETFARAIGDTFLSVWDDPDRAMAFDEPLAGGNGRLAEAAIWPILQGFHYLSVHDPGDVADYDGLDWISWHISIDYQNNEPTVVGLTFDQWAP